MLHHIEIYVSDLEKSHTFWKNILGEIGYVEKDRWDDGFTLVHKQDAYLTFVQRSEKYAFLGYNRCGVGLNHIAFDVDNRSKVDALRQYCLDRNIVNLYDDRYPYANGGDDYYALFVEDPDRIKVEFVAKQVPG